MWRRSRSMQRDKQIPLVSSQPVYLPVGNIVQQLVSSTTPYTGPTLQGEYRIVSLFTRTGQITSNDNVQFDNPVNPSNGTTYNPGYPFLATEQGTRGGAGMIARVPRAH